ncbi:MAG TPA: hypothetical protein VFW47_05410 [Phenylobacterium sp.]|nr:hypothetical protein [Phenylobacterium sp.]
MSRQLSVVSDQHPLSRETLSARIRALQEEARGLAREHINALEAALVEVERLACEISAGGDAYPAGVRDIARRLAEDCEQKVQTIEAISGRA